MFRASARGEGHISGLRLPVALDEADVGDCMLDDVEGEKYDWQVVAIYHIDGTPGVGPDHFGTYVEQAGFNFGFESESDPPVVE